MEQRYIKQEGNKRLLIFILGWAADETVLSGIDFKDYDVLCTYDYTNCEPLQVEGYESIDLIAWSFGVWAAERIATGTKLRKCVAVNGTPLPLSNEYGIPPRVLDLTIRSIEKEGINKFVERMTGQNPKEIKFSCRNFENQYQELVSLRSLFAKETECTLNWNSAVAGRQDIIIPTANQIAYWGNKAIERDIPHYPFSDIEYILSLLKD